jgi:MtN3 and saliva related transmembrane protein
MNAEWLGTIAATLTTISFVPQALKAIRSRETRGISLLMYAAFTVGIGFWFAYGVALHSWPMMVSNAVTFVLAAAILVLKLRFG